MKRRLKVDLAALEVAFESSDFESTWYLDLETGKVLLIPEETASYREELTALAEEQGIDFAQAVAQSDLPDWEKEVTLDADRIEAGFGSRFIAVEQDDSSEAFRDMEKFAQSVRNPAIGNRLLNALSGSRPFRRFKDAIGNYPEEEERWYAFRDERLRSRLLEWLAEEDIEVIE